MSCIWPLRVSLRPGTIKTEFAALFGVFGAEAKKHEKSRQVQIDNTPSHALMNGKGSKAAKLLQDGDTDIYKLLVLLQSMGYAVVQARVPQAPA